MQLLKNVWIFCRKKKKDYLFCLGQCGKWKHTRCNTAYLPFCCMPAPAPNKKLNGTIHSIFNSIVTLAVSRKMNVIGYIFEPPHVTCSVHFQTSCQTHQCSRCPYHSRPMLRSQEPENLKPKVGNTKGAI